MAPHPELVARWKEKLAAHTNGRDLSEITYAPVAWYTARDCKLVKEAKILGLTRKAFIEYLKVLFPNIDGRGYRFTKNDW